MSEAKENEQVPNMADVTQINIKIDTKIRNEIKIWSITHNVRLNDMLVKYITEGFEKEKSENPE